MVSAAADAIHCVCNVPGATMHGAVISRPSMITRPSP